MDSLVRVELALNLLHCSTVPLVETCSHGHGCLQARIIHACYLTELLYGQISHDPTVNSQKLHRKWNDLEFTSQLTFINCLTWQWRSNLKGGNLGQYLNSTNRDGYTVIPTKCFVCSPNSLGMTQTHTHTLFWNVQWIGSAATFFILVLRFNWSLQSLKN